MTHQLVVEFSTADQRMAAVLSSIAALPEWSPQRHEMEAHLHMTLARAAWHTADRLRDLAAKRKPVAGDA